MTVLCPQSTTQDHLKRFSPLLLMMITEAASRVVVGGTVYKCYIQMFANYDISNKKPCCKSLYQKYTVLSVWL